MFANKLLVASYFLDHFEPGSSRTVLGSVVDSIAESVVDSVGVWLQIR